MMEEPQKWYVEARIGRQGAFSFGLVLRGGPFPSEVEARRVAIERSQRWHLFPWTYWVNGVRVA